MVTLKDISRICDVSLTTVSLVLNDKPHRFSQETVSLIKKTAKELGYQPNSLARAMVTNKSGIIGLIIPDVNNPFFSEVAKLVTMEAHQKGYTVFLGETQNDNKLTLDILSKFISFQVDGIVVNKSSKMSSEEEENLISKVKSNKVPMVSIDSNIESDDLYSVTVDHEYGGYLATKHLISKGHKIIACLTGSPNSLTSEYRLKGYKRAIAEHGIDFNKDLLVSGNYTIDESCQQAVLNAQKHKATALFCFNDLMAVGAINECTKLEINVPNSLSIMGFDDTYVSELIYPKLTTIRQPVEFLAQNTMSVLENVMNNIKVDSKLLTLMPELVERESVGINK